MQKHILPLTLVLTFGVTMGSFAFRTWNADIVPQYMIDSIGRSLSLASEGAAGKHLYLRRTWRLTRTPEQAWIQLLGHDVMELYVNGRMAARTGKATQTSIAELITDVTPFLHTGKNSIAIHVSQTMLDRP